MPTNEPLWNDPFTRFGHHPDVNAALAAQEKRDRIDAAREAQAEREQEREQEPEQEPDLRAAVRELAEIVRTLCAWELGREINGNNPNSEDVDASRDLHDRAHALERRLS